MKQNLEQYLSHIFENAFEKCGLERRFGQVVVSSRPDLGQFQCNGAMAAVKAAKKAPFVIAEEVIAAVLDDERAVLSQLEVVKPGFINLSVTPEFLKEWTVQLKNDERFGVQKVSTPKSVVIDYGAPNVAKPMHVGHLRTTLIGDSLKRIYRFMGDNVKGDNHLGDWGTPMGMLIEHLKKKNPSMPYFDESFEGEYPKESPVTVSDLAVMYPEAAAICKADETEKEKARLATVELQQGRKGYRALWRHMVDVSIESLKVDFADLGVEFDLWLGESDSHPYIAPMVEDLKKRQLAVLSEGAVVVPVAEGEDDTTPPLILVKSDGAVMYGTTDLATIVQRVKDYDIDECLYVVDKRQDLHFKQVFLAAKKAGIVSEKVALKHIAFGTVNGVDGKPFKTRSGGVMKLSEMIAEAKKHASARVEQSEMLGDAEKEDVKYKIAMATIKFSELSNVRTSDYIFDLEKASQFEGKTGPYVLYSAVRIQSILRKAADMGVEAGVLLAPQTEAEVNLHLTLSTFAPAVYRAYEKGEPHHVCDYVYSLATAFSRFYNDCGILNEEDEALRASRLRLASIVRDSLEQGLDLLGISIPEKM